MRLTTRLLGLLFLLFATLVTLSATVGVEMTLLPV